MSDDEIRGEMTATYYDGGVSNTQIRELGSQQPSIKDFVKFAEKYQGVPYRALWEFGGLEFVFSYEPQFEAIGVSGGNLASCVDGDTDEIRIVCRKILVSMDGAYQLTRQGETQLASRDFVINPTAVKAFILAVLDAKERYQVMDVVPELYFLIGQVLLPGDTDAAKTSRSKDLKHWALLIAWAYSHKHGSIPSFRKLAVALDVAPSTLTRMFEGKVDFDKQVLRASPLEQDASKHPALKWIYPSL